MSEVLTKPTPLNEVQSAGELYPNKILNSIDVPLASGENLHNRSKEIDLYSSVEFQGTRNEAIDVEQDLIGVALVDSNAAVGLLRVRHGGETFFAVSKLSKNAEETGERAELLALINPGETLELGRNSLEPDNKTISSKHFNVTIDEKGKILVTDTSLNSTDLITFETQQKSTESIAQKGLSRFLKRRNQDSASSEIAQLSDFISDIKSWSVKSSILAELAKNEAEPSDWEYTQLPNDLIKKGALPGYEEPYVNTEEEFVPAKYRGREVIGRDTKINGGVYIVPRIQEAIVVDDGRQMKSKDTFASIDRHYESAYNDFSIKALLEGVSIDRPIEAGDEPIVAKAAFQSALDRLNYDKDYSVQIASEYADKKINLSELLADGKGVCRHQALLTAYYMERLIEEGNIGGEISVDRNYIKGLGGHAWARYTSPDGEIYIMDPAQKFFGTLSESKKSASWNYERPSEDK